MDSLHLDPPNFEEEEIVLLNTTILGHVDRILIGILMENQIKNLKDCTDVFVLKFMGKTDKALDSLHVRVPY